MTGVVDNTGTVLAYYRYSPFGEQTQIKGETPIYPITHEGFTGQQEVEMFQLIHMDGRLYDPRIGRFLSADPQVSDPVNTQSFNRYSYCLNNPLVYTDLTGYGFFDWLGHLFHDICHSIEDILSNQFVQLAVGILMNLIPGLSIWDLAFLNMATTALNGGNFEEVLGAGISLFADSGIDKLGEIFKGASNAFISTAERIGKELVGGGIQVLEGGKFQDTFLLSATANVFCAGLDGVLSKTNNIYENILIRTTASGVIGGVEAEAKGGNFFEAFTSSAYRQMLYDTMDTAHALSVNSEGPASTIGGMLTNIGKVFSSDTLKTWGAKLMKASKIFHDIALISDPSWYSHGVINREPVEGRIYSGEFEKNGSSYHFSIGDTLFKSGEDIDHQIGWNFDFNSKYLSFDNETEFTTDFKQYVSVQKSTGHFHLHFHLFW